jgi:hypothetical protein
VVKGLFNWLFGRCIDFCKNSNFCNPKALTKDGDQGPIKKFIESVGSNIEIDSYDVFFSHLMCLKIIFTKIFNINVSFSQSPNKIFPLEPELFVFSGRLGNSVLCLALGAFPSEKDRLHIYNHHALRFQHIALQLDRVNNAKQ